MSIALLVIVMAGVHRLILLLILIIRAHVLRWSTVLLPKSTILWLSVVGAEPPILSLSPVRILTPISIRLRVWTRLLRLILESLTAVVLLEALVVRDLPESLTIAILLVAWRPKAAAAAASPTAAPIATCLIVSPVI